MKYADLSRYSDTDLERMLDAYRTLDIEHLQHGHYALAAWARGMVTHITVEMNRRWALQEEQRSRQLHLYPVDSAGSIAPPWSDAS